VAGVASGRRALDTRRARAGVARARRRRARAGVARARPGARDLGGEGAGVQCSTRGMRQSREGCASTSCVRQSRARYRARATGGARTKTSAPRSSLMLCESPGAIPQVAEALQGSGEPSAGTRVKASQVRTAVPPPPPKRHATARPRPPAAL